MIGALYMFAGLISPLPMSNSKSKIGSSKFLFIEKLTMPLIGTLRLEKCDKLLPFLTILAGTKLENLT